MVLVFIYWLVLRRLFVYIIITAWQKIDILDNKATYF